MNRRLVFATLAVVLLTTGAGCSGFFGGISDEELDREQEYGDLRETETDAEVTIALEDGNLLGGGEFRASTTSTGLTNWSCTSRLSLATNR